MAAGGYTSIYRRGSSRPDENNGDAMALAYGAALKDTEFVQFRPTGMMEPDRNGQARPGDGPYFRSAVSAIFAATA